MTMDSNDQPREAEICHRVMRRAIPKNSTNQEGKVHFRSEWLMHNLLTVPWWLWADELAGMRAGADRIASWLTCKLRGRKLPQVMPWQSIAHALGDDRGLIDSDVPLDGHGAIPCEPVAKVGCHCSAHTRLKFTPVHDMRAELGLWRCNVCVGEACSSPITSRRAKCNS